MENKYLNDILGSIISNYRRDINGKEIISTCKFAEKCGLSKSLIYSLEKHTYHGNLCNITIDKLAQGMDISYYDLNEKIKNYYSNDITETENDSIIIDKNTRLYDLINLIKDMDEDNIKLLHNMAVKMK